MSNRVKIRFLARAAMIGAVYALLTVLLAPISYGPVQVRVAEMLMILPYFTAAAVPGLFIGCLIANIIGGYGLPDVIFGSLATLIAAFLAARIKYKYLVPMPAVLINAAVIGYMLHFVLGLPFYITATWVGLGQIIACYGLGLPLLLFLEQHRHIFK